MNIIKDEPLNSPLKSVILRLGGFHLEMSFVGGIGHLMEGSGITELLETVYAPNAVTHMTSGKVIARTETYLSKKACDDVLKDQIKSRIDNFRESHKSYRTSQLWFQYMDMIDILRRFIKAERTGNWELHLQTVKDMLPYLAASRHNLYVKSSRVYLQQMENLKTTHPEVLAFLQSGHHVIRRSDKFWAGLSSDLVIEQVLMRSL
ncbi:unnamed protein product [Mytilus edulis]|uniref:Uncharacterized protein n=1 Tax=Mytilus edulis TaxID=6550 RepID=A0A8S3VLI1_MYTED|nr:unnamed protein product [Mytilus edulis]